MWYPRTKESTQGKTNRGDCPLHMVGVLISEGIVAAHWVAQKCAGPQSESKQESTICGAGKL